VVERRPEPVLAVHPRGHPPHLRAERLQQQRERPVELVAKAATPPHDDLVKQVGGRERDRLGQVDAQVLERHGQQMGLVQLTKCRLIGSRWPGDTDAAEIAGQRLLVHG